MKLLALIKEMRRRRVFRGAGIYVVSAWLVLQVADVVVEPMGLPTWSMTLLLYLVLLGFPVALLLSWRYQLTETGLVRTDSAQGREAEEEPLSLNGTDYVILTALAVLLGVAVYGLVSEGEQLLVDGTHSVSAPAAIPDLLPNSIAVLPFTDMSAQQDQEHFADGLADTLLHVLAQIHDLKVAARTSSFAFKGKNENIRSIARQLGVSNVLEGSVQKSGNRLRVIAQLIEAENGTHLWSGTFDGALDDIFVIQDEIAAEVVGALKIALLEQDVTRMAERYRPKLAAYDELVLGRHNLNKATVEGLTAAAEHFRRASEIDPDYPLPYVYLSNTLGLLEIYVLGIQDTFSGQSTKHTREQQIPLIEKALLLDPLSGEAHASLASLQLDEKTAEANFLEAIELTPNYANAYLWYSRFLSIRQGRYKEALEQIERALELDPLSEIIRHEHAKMLWAVGQVEEAVAQMLNYVKESPDFPPYYKRMVRWQAQLGEMGEAMRWVQALRRLEPDSPSHWGEWAGECWVWGGLGDDDAARSCTQEFVKAHPESITARRASVEMGIPPDETSQSMSNYPETWGYAVSRKQELIELFEELVAEEPGNDYRANQFASFLGPAGQYERLVEVMAVAHPQFFTEPAHVTGETTWPATMTIEALQKLGREEEATRLIDAFEAGIMGMRMITGPGFSNGIENVELAAMRGNKEEAIRLLRKAVDRDWKFMWNYTPYMSSLEPIRDDPRFRAMYEEMALEIAEQRQWYYANQHKPLF